MSCIETAVADLAGLLTDMLTELGCMLQLPGYGGADIALLWISTHQPSQQSECEPHQLAMTGTSTRQQHVLCVTHAVSMML